MNRVSPRLNRVSMTAEECALVAQIAPVLLLALVVERREVAAMPRTAGARKVWLPVVGGYGALLAFAMIGGVAWSSTGIDGPGAAILRLCFWCGVGGAGLLLWLVFAASFRTGSSPD